jgi:polysaccharide pyruvyl transferase WcaK-like protein
LLAGYVGKRNTGADVRVEEMIRQFRAIYGDDQLDLTLLTIDPQLSAGYFRAVRQVRVPTVFPAFLFSECPRHDGVVACEGSMFKSKFATALSTMMAGALGMAAVEGKLSVGYGAEAGEMVPGLRDFVRKRCRNSLVLCRNEPSRHVLGAMGIRTGAGTDTAWTFEPAPTDRGRELLRAAGWDGKQPVLGVCPINPFWWPTTPDLTKAAALKFNGQFRAEHYDSIYFHAWSDEAARKYAAYIDAVAEAVGAFARERGAFVALIGMEQLDRAACEDVAQRLPHGAPLFISSDHEMYELVSVLRACDVLASSRYHAIVTSMPGLVPSLGVTMDERIRNIMQERDHGDLLFEVEQPQLADALLAGLRRLWTDRERVSEQIAKHVPTQLRRMGEMGIAFADEVARVYPTVRPRMASRSWEHYLPRLSPALERLCS